MTPHNIYTNQNVRIDTAIDTAAARMTGATPSDALRANVMSRVAVEQPARFAWRYVLAGGAIASIALVTFVSWPGNPEISQPPISNPTVISPTVINGSAYPTTAPSLPSPVTSVVSTARVERTAARTSFAMSEADLEWSDIAPPALARPDPLKRVESLEVTKPIDNITPLSVAPLVVPALGDDGSNR